MSTSYYDVRNRIKSRKGKAPRKQLGKQLDKNKYMEYLTSLTFRMMISVILFLVLSITVRHSVASKELVNKYLFTDNINFASINETFSKTIGGIIPFSDLFSSGNEPVSDKIEYSNVEPYLEGAFVTVPNNLVYALEMGMVTYIGEIEGYGNVLKIQFANGVVMWYGNTTNISVGIFDFVESGQLIGEVDGDKLYVAFEKEGEFLNISDYLND